MKHVWIAQCLCPRRHAIAAAAGEAESREEAQREIRAPLRGKIKQLLDTAAINPWCAICRAPAADWFIELGRTRFVTLEEATPTLQKTEIDNLISRARLGDEPKGEA
jgi:hypothetical protein